MAHVRRVAVCGEQQPSSRMVMLKGCGVIPAALPLFVPVTRFFQKINRLLIMCDCYAHGMQVCRVFTFVTANFESLLLQTCSDDSDHGTERKERSTCCEKVCIFKTTGPFDGRFFSYINHIFIKKGLIVHQKKTRAPTSSRMCPACGGAGDIKLSRGLVENKWTIRPFLLTP